MANQNTTASTSSNFKIMTLPQELRLAILEHPVVSQYPLELKRGLYLSAFATLSRTSKSLRMEAMQLFFSKNTFCIPGELDRDQELLSKAAVAFTEQIRFLRIQYLIRHDEHSWDAVTKHVRMMKMLKSCMIVLCGYRMDCAWRSQMPSAEDRSSQRERTIAEKDRDFIFGRLWMSKACNLDMILHSWTKGVQPVHETIVEAAREAHQRMGTDWSGFIEMTRRCGELW